MKLHEIVKDLREGQIIQRRDTSWRMYLTALGSFHFTSGDYPVDFGKEILLADDWEIVKEQKKVVIDGVQWTGTCGAIPYIPEVEDYKWESFKHKPPMRMELTWEE